MCPEGSKGGSLNIILEVVWLIMQLRSDLEITQAFRSSHSITELLWWCRGRKRPFLSSVDFKCASG